MSQNLLQQKTEIKKAKGSFETLLRFKLLLKTLITEFKANVYTNVKSCHSSDFEKPLRNKLFHA